MADVDTYVRYDYAWKTPGWSVQNPTYPLVADGYVDPGLPSDITKVRLFGEFMDWETGRALEGYLEIRTDTPMTYVPTGTRVMPGVKKIRFNKGGFAIYLPATDDDQLTPEFVYQARLTVSGYTNVFQFALPAINSDVNVLDLLPPAEGSVVIEPGVDPDGIDLGAVPRKLTVNLTTGSDFRTVLTNDENWAVGTTVQLHVGNLTWNATVSGPNASFLVDKAIADTVANGTPATLIVTDSGGVEDAWATGKVLRHG